MTSLKYIEDLYNQLSRKQLLLQCQSHRLFMDSAKERDNLLTLQTYLGFLLGHFEGSAISKEALGEIEQEVATIGVENIVRRCEDAL